MHLKKEFSEKLIKIKQQNLELRLQKETRRREKESLAQLAEQYLMFLFYNLFYF